MLDLCRVTQPFLHPAERIMVARQHPSLSSTHFIATDCSVIMMDERYPGYPVRPDCCYLRLSLHSCMSFGHRVNKSCT